MSPLKNNLLYLTLIISFYWFENASAYGYITNDTICPSNTTADNCEISVNSITKCDYDICGSDKMCKEYHLIANNLQYHPYLKVRDVSALTDVSRTTIDYNKRLPDETDELDHRSPYIYHQSFCPMTEFNYDERLVNESGFSPWEYVINRDVNRIPQDILETRCFCPSCLLANRMGTHRNYNSRPLLVTRYFRMKDNGTTVFNAKFSYGCICEFNGPFSPPTTSAMTEN